ncbi:MAG TPA: DUF4345 family protein [Mesotoga sp.]|jgi:hypothetical protein|nr:DUF4345 family protein [Mesotoga sp.]MDI9374457.1 DUF4345 family protein [Thermotogota bacterium]MDD4477817.1 DUF4345 family protein [Mesotoga sp.]MDD5744037.1 DUF4345 family protein [Mesotoga sp.]HOI62686.1 DUF4345 family protein [Mesotoga sp.]
MVLTIAKFIISILTATTGLYIIIRPQSYARLAGFSAGGDRGRVEIRTIMGGAFLGLGLAPVILFNYPIALTFVGVVYIFVALTRLVSLFLDRSFEFSSIMFLIVEASFGLIMVIPS